jgi:hypothetical protein
METLVIEARLYDTLVPGAPSIKTAMLLLRTFKDEELPNAELINQALGQLAQRPDVASFGNLAQWRSSELMRMDDLRPDRGVHR